MKFSTKGIAIIAIILVHSFCEAELFAKSSESTSKAASSDDKKPSSAETEADHDHEHEHDHEGKEAVDHKDDHGKEEKGHDHGHEKEGEGHGHGHDEKKANVGPNKGVTFADEDKGFVLKEKVEANFSIKKKKVTGSSSIVVPKSSLLFSGMEKQVYRYRDTYWKAVDVVVVKKGPDFFEISSKELAAGDSIAVSGIGFLKIIEQSVFGPAIEGHVH